ncbi:hypothetical protein M0R89_14360 [Halorussus limi]|uniref:Major cell surface glycoprotein n=1 Tax=Halorussus limi TaxID=2938695 RepID=A0A8U0HSP9_9EURY|nr:hypothetical protein [Halorussus limi]UPV73716.1 hypothetical protein M0R89_14360 [Halorussus limi]
MADSSRQRRRLRVALAVSVALLAALSLSMATATPAGERGSQVRQATLADLDERSVSSTDPGQRATTDAAENDSADSANRTGPTFDATVFRDIAGQVATEDATVTVRGTATETDEVLVALFDRRGRVLTESVSVGDDGTFEEEDLELVADGTPLAEGRVVATVLSPGRDAQVGDGEVGNATEADLAAFAAAFRETVGQRSGGRVVSRTQRQLVELYYDQTVEDAGSDDLLLAEEFVYTDARTSIERVAPRSAGNATGPVEPIRVGDTLVVRGLTNRRPEDNTVFVEVVSGPSADAFDLAATETWGTDGVWRVELDAADVQPGVYTIEAEDGASSDSVRVRILPRVGNATVENATTANTTAENGSVGSHRRISFFSGGLFAESFSAR